jgi:hypothetical protein
MPIFFLFALVASSLSGAVVMKPVANMYSMPSEEADVVSQAILGTNVDVVEEEGVWAKVCTPDNYAGWMPQTSIRRLGADDKPYASAGRVAQVESLFANLYSEPDVTKHQPLLMVPFETRLEALAEPSSDEGRWVQVRLPDDRLAWVERGDVIFNPKPSTLPQTIALAKRFLGLPYLWGGTSSFGFDCSGFMQMLMRQRGVIMPRDAGMQAAWSGLVPVKRKNLTPGDLLFFGSSLQKITHAGMYIGHGEFIHDTARGHPGVQISRLADPYWAKLLVSRGRLK